MAVRVNKKEQAVIERAVNRFQREADLFDAHVNNLRRLLTSDRELRTLLHSYKWRVKDPDHLRDKLERWTKLRKLQLKDPAVPPDEVYPEITADNLFEEVTDLAGLRLLHLHTNQFEAIHQRIIEVLEAERYTLLPGSPVANTWDSENQKFFKDLGIETAARPSLYTSVHYIVKPNREEPIHCEVQVRTLSEEVWGEVSHTINYPHPTDSVACQEQLKALARVTSSCTRLVDSLFRSKDEYDDWG